MRQSIHTWQPSQGSTKAGTKAGSVATSSSKKRKRATEPKEKAAKAPWQRLAKKDVQLVCEELKEVDAVEIRSDVARQVVSGYHMLFFEERLNLWKHIKSTNVMALDSLISTVLVYFVKMYRQHSKGKDKYTCLLLGWHMYMKQCVVQERQLGVS